MMTLHTEIDGRQFAANNEQDGVFELVRGAYLQHRGTEHHFSTEEQFRAYVERMLRADAGEPRYAVECRHVSGSSQWEREPETECDSREEAQAMIEGLEPTDADGNALEYRVVEVAS